MSPQPPPFPPDETPDGDARAAGPADAAEVADAIATSDAIVTSDAIATSQVVADAVDRSARVGDWSTRRVAALATAAVVLLCVSTVTLLARLADRPVAGVVEVPEPADVPDDLGRPGAVTEAIAERAREAAGCVLLVDGDPYEDRTHVDINSAPPPAALYPDHRPAHSGRHYPRVLALPDRVPTSPIDERAVVHNMEHGSVVVWFDADHTDVDTIGVMQDWMRQRAALGFTSDAQGGVFVSAADVIDSGKPVALRAWGVAMDCDRFDLTVADAFLADHWGSHGESPEAHLSPYPEGVLDRGTTT